MKAEILSFWDEKRFALIRLEQEDGSAQVYLYRVVSRDLAKVEGKPFVTVEGNPIENET